MLSFFMNTNVSKERSVFSKNLARIRKQRNLSQIDLANITGLSDRMIAYYETRAVNPPLDKVEIIAKALKVRINDLLGSDDETNIQKEITQIDTRTLKKLKIILSLPRHQRHMIYSMAESLLKQNQETK